MPSRERKDIVLLIVLGGKKEVYEREEKKRVCVNM